MVDEGVTGMKFAYGDVKDLQVKVKYMFEHHEEAERMGANGYKLIETEYSPETHYEQLLDVFKSVI